MDSETASAVERNAFLLQAPRPRCHELLSQALLIGKTLIGLLCPGPGGISDPVVFGAFIPGIASNISVYFPRRRHATPES
jgi:hypothetical protein